MSIARTLAAAATAAMVVAASMSPAAAQQPPQAEPVPEVTGQGSAAGDAPTLGAGFVLEGVWLAPGVASLGWDDVEAAAGYELMFRSADGWVLLSEDEPRGGVSVAFEGSSAALGGLPQDAAQWWFAVRARNAFGVSEWSQSAAVAAPQRAEAEPAFDPFTAPTRSGIDLERLREAAATITPGDADCAAVPALDVEGVTVVDPPAGLDDPDAELTVAEVARVSGGCLIAEYVALAGRTVAQVRDLLATDASVHAVGEPARGLALADNTGAHTHTGGHHNDSGRTDGEQWHLPQPTMTALWDGWNDDPDRQVVVAVIDTGVDTTHPDLDDNVAADSPGGCHTTDNNGHGTRMAGIIAAELGGGHVAGVAPKAKILPLRMARLGLDPEDTDCSDPDMRLAPMTAPAAIAEAVNRGARVINMSFADPARRDGPDIVAGGVGIPSKDTYELVLRAAAMLGVVAVTSAGNCGAADGKDLTAKQKEDCSEQDAAERPALYDDVIAVASINSAGARVDSSTANEHVDVAAPGDDILTTRASCTGTHCVQESGKTSAAAAFVSGVVAHLLNRYPQASVGQVRRALEQSALRPPLPPRHPEDIGPFRPENPAIRLKWTPRGPRRRRRRHVGAPSAGAHSGVRARDRGSGRGGYQVGRAGGGVGACGGGGGVPGVVGGGPP